ncbi:uncharacterized protein [Eurosta solidaginis]|uniref:uncharacterized protein n=1 Tax=Eurosta solidaginis TaxID=178769 RepID=UPI00353149AE
MQCRACRRSGCETSMDMGYVIPTDGKTLYDYFNDCTQLKATTFDNLPKILCMNCAKLLQQAYDFRQEARKSDEELKKSLVLAQNKAAALCDPPFGQSAGVQNTETASPFHLLYVSPKIETAFVDPEHANVSQDTEVDKYYDSEPTKNESLLLYETTDQGEGSKDNDSAPTIDPLNMLKDEIKLELSDDMLEESNEEHSDDNINDTNDNNNKVRRKKSFKCDICVYKGRRKAELKNHIFAEHKDAILCEECCKVFEFPGETQMHKKLVHETDIDMCCPWCKNSNLMRKDILAKHLEKNHKCNYSKYFPRLRVLCRKEDDPFQCERCPKFFPSINELADHIQEHTYDCPMCSMSFKKFFGYKAHMKRIHHQIVSSIGTHYTGNRQINMQFDCPICKIQYKLKENLRKHMQTKHKEGVSHSKNGIPQGSLNETGGQKASFEDVEESTKLVEGEECRLGEQEKQNSKGSNKEKNYICSYCPREFTKRRYASIHEQTIHLGEKSLRKTCPICQKEVVARYLNTHITSMHTSEPTFDCELCGDLFKTYALLSNHKSRKHLNRKYPCTVCNKRFICASELKVHMRMHTGEEPYACHLCERRFKIKGLLTYHLQKHAGIKRDCNVCGKEFNSIAKLKTHSYTHTGMPYRCRWCDYGCVKRLKFKEHLLRIHSKTLTETELSDIFKANTGRESRARLGLENADDVMQDTDYSNSRSNIIGMTDTLKQQRANTKKNISRIKTIIETNGKGEGKGLETIELKCRLGILESYFTQLMSYQIQIEKLEPDDNMRGELEDLYVGVKIAIQEQLGEDLNSSILGEKQVVIPTYNSKLRVLKLPTFTGKYSEYKNVITSFNQIIDRELGLSNIEKFNHLRNCLQGQALETVKVFQVPRYCLQTTVLSTQLHGFCDSSIRAYGCCVYVRAEDKNGNATTRLITAKSRMAPTKKKSLPKLELCGAQLLAQLVSKVRHIFVDQDLVVYLWTDSQIVLHWLRMHSSTLSAFVGNRVSEIQELTSNCHWRHVPTQHNPADIVSRGCTVSELQKSIWYSGPPFLKRCSEFLPENSQSCPDMDEIIKEKRKAIFFAAEKSNYIIEGIAKYSMHMTGVRVIAWMFRFYRKTNKASKNIIDTPNLSPQEIETALCCIIWNIQQQYFSEDICCAKKGKPAENSLKFLNPFMSDTCGFNFLKVGGRLELTSLPHTQRHPVLLPSKCHFVECLVRHLHITNFHAGPKALVALIRLRAPHFRGLWEAAVKSAKGHLNRTLGNARLTYEELTTAVIEIEAILNSRPLTPLSSDPNDYEALTPAHFIIGSSLKAIPERNEETNKELHNIDRWKRISAVKHHFWRQWSREYLSELHSRNKWVRDQPNVHVDSLVIIHEDNVPPQRWITGRIVAAIPGKDKRVRVVDVQTSMVCKMQCRACASFNCEDSLDMSFVPPSEGKTLYEQFNYCTQLKATAKDALPNILCMNCIQSLQQAYNFRQQAHRSDEELRKTLVLTKIETDLVSDSVEQPEVVENTEAVSLVHPLATPPKIETDYPSGAELSKVLDGIECATFDIPSPPTKDEFTEVYEDIDDTHIIDQLSASGYERRSVGTKTSDLNILKEVTKGGLTNDMLENVNEGPSHTDNEDNTNNHVIKAKQKFKCGFCDFKSSKKGELKRHVFDLHKDTILCHICFKIFELPDEMDIHNKLVHDSDSDMSCPWCKNSYTMRIDELIKHLRIRHPFVYKKYFPPKRVLRREDNPLQCERCQKIFSSIYDLAEHKREHKFDCAICSLSFEKKNVYKAHMKRIHNKTLTTLKEPSTKCHEVKKSLSGLQIDINTPDQLEILDDARKQQEVPSENEKNGKKFLCAYCPRKFKNSAHVKTHEQKIHQSSMTEREKCPICKKILDAQYLKTHMANIHNPERKFKCEICGNSYRSNAQLWNHKYLHLNRKHQCTLCTKRFVGSYELKVHMRVHTGEEPYACHLCDRRFKIKVHLTYHLQQHAGVKQKCKVCGKEFNRGLKQHSYTHTGMPYRCTVCDFKVANRNAFRKHLLRAHNKTLTEHELSEMFKANTGRYGRVTIFTTDEVKQD